LLDYNIIIVSMITGNCFVTKMYDCSN